MRRRVGLMQMSMRDLQYDFLEDGQILPTLNQWRSRLESDVDEALSVCRLSRDRLKAEACSLQESAEVVVRRMGEALRGLEQTTLAAQSRIPRPRGIFFDASEKRGAFEGTCLFLSELQPALAALQASTTPTQALRQSLKKQDVACLCVQGELLTAREAAASLELSEVVGLLSELLREVKDSACESLYKAVTKRQELVLSLVQSVATSFLGRISGEADIGHEGVSASPTAVLRSMGELCDRIRQTERSILSGDLGKTESNAEDRT